MFTLDPVSYHVDTTSCAEAGVEETFPDFLSRIFKSAGHFIRCFFFLLGGKKCRVACFNRIAICMFRRYYGGMKTEVLQTKLRKLHH